MATRFGLIGLGNIGGPMAMRAAEQGIDLHVFDLSDAARANLRATAVTVHDDFGSLAKSVDVVFTSLPSLDASQAVVRQIGAVPSIRVHVELSTVGPPQMAASAAYLAKFGILTLDAAVSGGATGARAGTLSAMLGGSDAACELAMPFLQAIASKIFVIGENPGDGQRMKLINNLLCAANYATAFEALAMGTKLGLKPRRMAEVIRVSSGNNSGMVERKTNPIFSGSFSGSGKISLLEKDISLAFEEAEAAGFDTAKLRALQGAASLWSEATRRGMSDQDVTALIKIVEQETGVEVRDDILG